MVGRTLSHHLKHGKLTFLGKPLYNSLIAMELGYVRWKDRNKYFGPTSLVDEKLTAIVKTFERPETVTRLLESIKRFYPNMRVIVVDDSREPLELEGVKRIVLPYDSGVSAGRQAALEAVETSYVLLLDDDFVFYGETDLEPAMRAMEANEAIDIMGGTVVNLPSFKSADYRKAGLHPTSGESVLPEGALLGGFPVYDKVANFYIARTQRLKLVGWDARIKRLDHADFFSRAKGVLRTVYNEGFKVLHAQTPFNKVYMEKRRDVAMDRLVIMAKYYKKRELKRFFGLLKIL